MKNSNLSVNRMARFMGHALTARSRSVVFFSSKSTQKLCRGSLNPIESTA
jgi:hypothetical protein